jgi:pSer/pThr/pTyr-binding forkhead associated (FHA) protein
MLKVVRGPDTGTSVELSRQRTVIGRRQGELVLSDREVSSVHAAVEIVDGAYVLRDLGSTNGTFLDGQRISSHELSTGSHVKCGASYLLFEVSAAHAEAEPILDAELIDEGEPLIAASSDGAAEPVEALGLGPAPTGLDDDTPPPLGAPLMPPGGSADTPAAPPVPASVAPTAPGSLPDEGPTGVAPPSSLPAGASIPPAVALVPPAGTAIPPAGAPLPPAGPPAPAAAEAPPADAGAAPAPPRVGVTSHGSDRESKGGTPWDSLALPEAGAPIAPSPGGRPHVATPLPGSIQLPPAAPPAPAAPSFADAPTPLPSAAPMAAPALPPGVEASPHDLYLVVEAGADAGKVFPVSNDLTVLGRSDLDVQIHDPDVSRKHVVLELQGPGPHLLRDLGSTNGTLLNGVKVTENLIAPNDILRMGVTRIKLVSGAEALQAEMERIASG